MYFHHSSDKSGLKVADCTVQSAEYWCFYGTCRESTLSVTQVDFLHFHCYWFFRLQVSLEMIWHSWDSVHSEQRVQDSLGFPVHFHILTFLHSSFLRTKLNLRKTNLNRKSLKMNGKTCITNLQKYRSEPCKLILKWHCMGHHFHIHVFSWVWTRCEGLILWRS